MKLSSLLLLVLFLALPSMAEAKRYTAVKDGKEVVVHTNRAPVVVHRIFPPYGLGKHVHASQLPQPPAGIGDTAAPAPSTWQQVRGR